MLYISQKTGCKDTDFLIKYANFPHISSVILLCADKFDPYTDISEFTTEGREEWVNEGHRLAVEVRKLLPKNVDLYYGFWHQFGDSKWRHCRAYIAPNM